MKRFGLPTHHWSGIFFWAQQVHIYKWYHYAWDTSNRNLVHVWTLSLFFFFSGTHETCGHLARFFRQVEKRFHDRELNHQPFHLVLGTSSPSCSSLRSTWTFYTRHIITWVGDDFDVLCCFQAHKLRWLLSVSLALTTHAHRHDKREVVSAWLIISLIKYHLDWLIWGDMIPRFTSSFCYLNMINPSCYSKLGCGRGSNKDFQWYMLYGCTVGY